MAKLTKDALEESVEEVGLREANVRLQAQLVKAKDRTQKLVDVTIQAAYDAMLADMQAMYNSADVLSASRW